MSKTILTVDDAATMRKMISFTLRAAGYAVVEAADGMDALELVARQHVDLVITDVNMPRMDGIQLTAELRSQDRFKAIPILLLTTESAPEMKARGRAAGATGWIVKPFEQQQLSAAVAKVFERAS